MNDVKRGRFIAVAVMLAGLAAPVAIAQKSCDVRTYGAKPDGTTKNTLAIQKAIDECAKAGGGTVLLAGGNYVSGPIDLRSHVTLNIAKDSAILGSEDFDDYPNITELGEPGRKPLIGANHAEDIAITGGGTVDGRGEKWWVEARKVKNSGIVGQGFLRPRLIVISYSKDFRMDHVTVKDSPMWQIVPYYTDGIKIQDVKVLADPHSPNTDGIDPFSSSNILIERVTADVGDDNIAIKSGNINSPGPDAPSKNIVIRDCTFLHGHGLSIGSEIAGGAQNVSIENVKFDGTDQGIRIKANRDRGHDVSGIRVKNIEMKNVKNAILISEYYPKVFPPAGDGPAPITRLTPFFHDIQIEHVKVTNSKAAGVILGLPESPVKDVLLKDVSIDAEVGMTVGNAEVKMEGVHITAQKGPAIVEATGAKIQQTK
ncbi:glycoside hydrolase family 28 protein [Granulicella cerasi]|uniref:Glycoside hydrolase family 28 protein n=1 Tax=Granulicella cerasi TaxID=741063 RepID=A0ABW1ZEQ7_9BACT|nr:glycoside hydrolase family 28 protein [Granulicella cerasi]